MKKRMSRLIKYLALSLMLFVFLSQSSCSNDNDFEEQEQGQQEPGQEEVSDEAVPFIEITTQGPIVDDPKVKASIKISEKGNVVHEGHIGIELRGASSLHFDKKSYGVETWDANGEDIDVSLLGMPAEEDWVLHGPYSDKSLMRNKLMYDISNDMGRYASRTQFVELKINAFFKGVYVFMEKLKRDKERIDIKKLNIDENSGEDLTGGYILKIDKTAGSNLGDGYNHQNSFRSEHKPKFSEANINFLYEYPDAEDITSQQKEYISSYVKGFENALASDNFKDPEVGYRAFIDVPSFVDFFILNELSNNVDGYRISTYMHKDKNGKLKMGPIWDFNLGFGNADYCSGESTEVWAYKFNERCPGDYWSVPFWWYRLLEDPYFVEELKQRWNVLRGNVLSVESIKGKTAAYETKLNESDAIHTNFTIWNILGEYVWPNNFVGTSHTAERIYLEEWVSERVAWLDVHISQL
ncbi:CotH kinase family protein [Lutimonas sp.]|uniref:CotH kinase family protein n=1 Tax=Lutimonas sp. TaxID=1872403 RepID=UPI003D9AE2DE